jgi:DNA-directed RNA polymerase subunit RPC12/RpoP
MKLNKEETKLFLCPFCGAPQRMIIPDGTLQVKCPYCGGVILVPPWLGGKTVRCVNHPERLAVGVCNDCGRNFCAECLYIYHLRTRDAKATLYLDQKCLRKRYAEKTNKTKFFGIATAAYGVFLSMISLMFGIFIIICGVALIAYSIFKSKETPPEVAIGKTLMERQRIEADPTLKKAVDAEKLYNELLTEYVHKWGGRTGIDLLQSEISAYTRQGVSFPEAVNRIYARIHRA